MFVAYASCVSVFHVFVINFDKMLGFNPINVHALIAVDAGVRKRLAHGFVRVAAAHILADERNSHIFRRFLGAKKTANQALCYKKKFV